MGIPQGQTPVLRNPLHLDLLVVDEASMVDLELMAAVLGAFADFQQLCALRRGPWGVAGLNQQIARALRNSGLIEREEGWYAGRPVLMTHNDYSLVLPSHDTPILTRELYYTAITRARQRFTLLAANSALQLTAVERKTARYSGLRERLWGAC